MTSIDSVNKSTHDSLDEREVKIDDLLANDISWWKVSHLRMLILAIFLISMTPTINGYDGSMLNGLQSLPHWRSAMGNPERYVLGHLSTGPIYGGIICIPIAPIICDKYGRRISLFVGGVLAIIGGVLQGVSNSYGLFLGSRMIIGFGGYMCGIAAPVLISEISYPSHRETCTFGYNVCWYIGAIAAAWVTYATRVYDSNASWKIPSYLQALLPLIQVLFIWIIPESPRFYISKGKKEKAREVLTKYHIGNSTDPERIKLVDFEMEQIETAINSEKASTNSSYLDFITKANFRKRLFICIFVPVMQQLSGNALVSYYLAKVLESIGITGSKEQLEINGCLMIYNLVICCTLTGFVRKIKRRTMFLTCIPGMLISYIIWTILSARNQQTNFEHKSLANGVLAMIFFFYFFYDIGLNGLPSLYLTEILPFSHRAKGFNISLVANLCVSVFNGYANPVAMYYISWKYYIVYCVFLAFELVLVYFFFPETSGYTLEEVGQVFGDIPVPPISSTKLGELDDAKVSVVHEDVAQKV